MCFLCDVRHISQNTFFVVCRQAFKVLVPLEYIFPKNIVQTMLIVFVFSCYTLYNARAPFTFIIILSMHFLFSVWSNFVCNVGRLLSAIVPRTITMHRTRELHPRTWPHWIACYFGTYRHTLHVYISKHLNSEKHYRIFEDLLMCRKRRSTGNWLLDWSVAIREECFLYLRVRRQIHKDNNWSSEIING